MTYFEQLMAKYLDEKVADAKTEKAKESVLRALEIRFKTVPKNIRERVESFTDLIALDSLHALAITCESIKEFKEHISE